MITKQRLSDNTSLDDIATPISGCDTNTGETSRESMNRENQCTNDQQSEDCGTYRQRSVRKQRLSGSLLSDDSCNAVDNMLGVDDERPQKECTEPDQSEDLSFNGKIKSLTNECQNTTRPLTNSIERLSSEVPQVANAGCSSDLRSREEKFNESFELLTKENHSLHHYNNEKSPDLFADDDDDDEEEANRAGRRNGIDQEKDNYDYLYRSNQRVSGVGAKGVDCEEESSTDRVDRILLKRVQMSLAGIPPPPALTYSDIDVGTMLTIYRSNADSWLKKHGLNKFDNAGGDSESDNKQHQQQQQCLTKPTRSVEELASMQWPELKNHRAHGLHYNRSRVSENFELLSLKYIERYISAETSCSFNMTILHSSAKKRNQRLKMLNQSPGRRLSHLARRRATFSSESLLNTSGSKSGTIVSAGKAAISAGVLRKLNPHRVCNNRQVLLDPKKSDNRRKNKIKTPKRRTPGRKKSPRRRTPGSSAKKLSLLRTSAAGKSSAQVHVPATRESSRRALFLSPQNREPSNPAPNDDHPSLGSNSKQTERSIFSDARMLKSKRSLFSQPSATTEGETTSGLNVCNVPSSMTTNTAKRRRSSITDDHGEENAFGERTEKIRRTESSGLTEEDLTPRSLKFARSKSFCVGLQSMTQPAMGSSEIGGKSLIRANSEISSADGPRPLLMLTENHKKKLLWAVSQALQSKQITAKHELFKQHASNLVRVVKKLFLEFNDQTTSSTSEKLLKLANKHVYEVMQGKSVDDIYFREKTRIMNARNLRKLQGYIAPEEYELRKLNRTASITSFDGSSPFDCSLSASQSCLSQSSMLSQGSSFAGLSQLSQTSSVARASHLKPAASTGSVNMAGVSISTALRENVDSELRQRSVKKQLLFSGKDQKNVSPYRTEKNLAMLGSNANANKLLVGVSFNSSIMKAKRQISFE